MDKLQNKIKQHHICMSSIITLQVNLFTFVQDLVLCDQDAGLGRVALLWHIDQKVVFGCARGCAVTAIKKTTFDLLTGPGNENRHDLLTQGNIVIYHFDSVAGYGWSHLRYVSFFCNVLEKQKPDRNPTNNARKAAEVQAKPSVFSENTLPVLY